MGLPGVELRYRLIAGAGRTLTYRSAIEAGVMPRVSPAEAGSVAKVQADGSLAPGPVATGSLMTADTQQGVTSASRWAEPIQVLSILVRGMMTARSRGWLLMVGFVSHAPGLKLLFHRSLPSAARRENILAIISTLSALSAAVIFDVDCRWLVTIWLVGHFAWGARVAWLLWRDTRS